MHQPLNNFVDQLKKAAGPKKLPIALIRAEGVRSARMQKILKLCGLKSIINVEGMDGGKYGLG